ncbi:MAG: 6-phosphogluconolactonase [Nitrospirae bacterium]|nr:6-phosphogluconolactonase [Nitrospirota bacterium]
MINVHYKNKEVFVFKDINELADFAIAKWAELSEKAIRARGAFTVALPGGRTPVVLYRKLSDEKTLPWDKTHIFMTDERFVPYEAEENNFHMLSRTLLGRINIPKENIHSISTKEAMPLASAVKYEEDLIAHFRRLDNKYPEFDLILLGIGDDGHTASLFPDASPFAKTRHLAITVSPKDKTKKERITLTLPVINNAENVMFLAAGNDKAGIIKEVLEAEDSLLPAALVRPKKGGLIFLLDEGAASLLSLQRR